MLFLVMTMVFTACETTTDLSHVDFSGPPTIIYKMKNDYSKLVPVVLNEDKTAIISYPAPKDLLDHQGHLRYPTQQERGYYLDELGVGVNTAYISISMDKYCHMIAVPSLDSLFSLVIDDDPFMKMYNLGNRKQYLDTQRVAELISSGKYKHYEKLK